MCPADRVLPSVRRHGSSPDCHRNVCSNVNFWTSHGGPCSQKEPGMWCPRTITNFICTSVVPKYEPLRLSSPTSNELFKSIVYRSIRCDNHGARFLLRTMGCHGSLGMPPFCVRNWKTRTRHRSSSWMRQNFFHGMLALRSYMFWSVYCASSNAGNCMNQKQLHGKL